jgi:AcrR family transcriptional regulator
MEAAIQLFSAEGYKAASVDEICARAGVSKGAFYYHFKAKRELFLALLKDWLDGLDRAMHASRRSTVPETLLQFTEVLPMMMGSAQGRLNMWLEFWLQASRDKGIWTQTIAPYRHYRELFSGMIEEGIAEGTLRKVDPQVAAQAILSMAVGLFLQSVLDPKGGDWQAIAEHSVQLLMTGMTRSQG